MVGAAEGKGEGVGYLGERAEGSVSQDDLAGRGKEEVRREGQTEDVQPSIRLPNKLAVALKIELRQDDYAGEENQ
jgi:hypothetical protein